MLCNETNTDGRQPPNTIFTRDIFSIWEYFSKLDSTPLLCQLGASWWGVCIFHSTSFIPLSFSACRILVHRQWLHSTSQFDWLKTPLNPLWQLHSTLAVAQMADGLESFWLVRAAMWICLVQSHQCYASDHPIPIHQNKFKITIYQKWQDPPPPPRKKTPQQQTNKKTGPFRNGWHLYISTPMVYHPSFLSSNHSIVLRCTSTLDLLWYFHHTFHSLSPTCVYNYSKTIKFTPKNAQQIKLCVKWLTQKWPGGQAGRRESSQAGMGGACKTEPLT